MHEITPLLRIKDVLKIFPVSKSSWHRGVAAGNYPKPVKGPGGRTAFYRESDIRALIERISGKED